MRPHLDQREDERKAFAAFLEAYPGLHAQLASWTQPVQDPPDVVAKLKSGEEIPFELAEWLHEAQRAATARLERLQEALGAVIGRPTNQTKHVRFISIKPLDAAPRFDAKDASAFSSELLGVIAKVDRQRDEMPSWRARDRFTIMPDQIRRYPALDKYVERIVVDWRSVSGEEKPPFLSETWVTFAPWGGFYDEQDALNAVRFVIEKKARKYGTALAAGTRLLVYYNTAAVYNTPFIGLNMDSFEDAARLTADSLRGRHVPFRHVYFLYTPRPGLEAFEVYPGFAPLR